MTHGDDKGLVLPPKITPLQVVFVPIWRNDEQRAKVLENIDRLKAALVDRFTLKVDDREGVTPGFKFNDWELRGVPVRIELGPRDVENQQMVLVRRDTGEKMNVSQDGCLTQVETLLADIQTNLYQRALAFRDANTYHVERYDEFKAMFSDEQVPGFLVTPWCGQAVCEEKIKEETKATSRCIPFDREDTRRPCVACGTVATETAVFAKAY